MSGIVPNGTEVQLFQDAVFRTAEYTCQSLWQRASKRMQALYPRFHLSPVGYRAHTMAFESRKDVLTIDDLVEVLDPVVGLRERCGYTPHVNLALRYFSLGTCVLGSPACPGDLDLSMRLFAEEAPGSPQEIYDEFKKGDRATMVVFLNALLAQSAEQIAGLDNRGTDNPQKRVFYLERSSGKFCLDGKVLQTRYHLYCSLAALVEGPQGHA